MEDLEDFELIHDISTWGPAKPSKNNSKLLNKLILFIVSMFNMSSYGPRNM